jgi:hypothetical protein
LVLEAVKSDGFALQFASEELQADRVFVLNAVKQSGWALKYASRELRADRAVVLEAVKSVGFALQFASEELQADRKVVLEAVKINGKALQYASKALQSDIALFDEAYRSKSASEALEASIWTDPNAYRPFMHQRLCHVYRLFKSNAWFKNWLGTLFGKHLDDASFLVIEQLSFKDAVRSREVCQAGLKELLLHRGTGQSSANDVKRPNGFVDQSACTKSKPSAS